MKRWITLILEWVICYICLQNTDRGTKVEDVNDIRKRNRKSTRIKVGQFIGHTYKQTTTNSPVTYIT